MQATKRIITPSRHQQKKDCPAGEDLEIIIGFSEGQTLMRDGGGNLFTALNLGEGNEMEDMQSVTLLEACSWFVNGSKFCVGFDGDPADLIKLVIPFLPRSKSVLKTL
jgi:hypothetical protein